MRTSGAVGKFELASGGTLFLDEIGDMSLGGQAKLLRVLEEKLVVRVGGSTSIHTNARVLAATNQNLVELVRQKKFREDLYFRLNVVTLELPPLRDRGDDILVLAEQFLTEFSRQARRKPPHLTAAARKRLLGHAWPGNVRELRNLMERMVYLTSDDKVDADELAFIMSPRGDDSAWLAVRHDFGGGDAPVPGPVHPETGPAGPGQHDQRRRTTGPAPRQSLPQDAAIGHGDALGCSQAIKD